MNYKPMIIIVNIWIRLDKDKKNRPLKRGRLNFLNFLFTGSKLVQQGYRQNDDTGNNEDTQITGAHNRQSLHKQINTH